MEQQAILQLIDIKKRFKGIVALDGARFEAMPGEIHALLGENGAGKSTLLNIMSGSLSEDSGRILFKGEPIRIPSPLAAKRIGIVKVHQELQVCPDMMAYENIFLGNELMTPKARVLWRKKMRERAREILDMLNADFSESASVGSLSIAQQQLVEIAKALLNDFSVIILDEPTSSLMTKEIKKLFAIMRMLKAQGKAVVFVSHRLDEVFEITDRITVFKDGKFVETVPTAGIGKPQLIQLMTGREIGRTIEVTDEHVDKDEIVFEVRGLNGPTNRFKDISFHLYKGEILGFAGLVGSGRTETMRAVYGADRKTSGEILMHGKPVRIDSPRDSIDLGIALVPEDRKRQGMVGMLPNMTNIGLSSFHIFAKGQPLTDRKIAGNAIKYMAPLYVRPMKPRLPTENLSGGNQQKIVIGKYLSVNARILIMDEPTRGIDVGAKDEIYKLMIDLTKQGVSIIMISSELPEVLGICNRIIVMNEGRIAGELAHGEATERKILQYAMVEEE